MCCALKYATNKVVVKGEKYKMMGLVGGEFGMNSLCVCVCVCVCVCTHVH